MKTYSWADRFRYKFDNMMSRGPIALILWLFMASIVLILVVSLLAFVIRVAPEGGEPLSFAELMWMSLMRTLDAGTMGGDTGWGVRIFMFIITLGGVFVVSMLIGVLTTTIEGKIVDLRKGHSFVVENGHTVLEAARQRGEVAVGYRCYTERNNSEKAYGVVVNPVKSKLVSFTENDRIIVLAEN